MTAKSGTFGNILIEANQIRSSNNKFILTDAGVLSAEDVSLSGTFRAGTLSNGVFMSEDAMTIYNGAYGGVSFANDGQNSINGLYLEINVGTLLVSGFAGISKLIDFGGGKTITVTKGLITNQTGF